MSKRTFEEQKTIAINSLKRAGCVAAGCIGGKFLNNFIANKTVGTSGDEEDLLGLSPKFSKWVTPALVAAAGVATTLAVKNQMAKDVALGVMSAGCVSLVQSAFKKDLSTLSPLNGNDVEDQPIALPGVGSTLPGIGDITYEELPSENDYVNNFQSQPDTSEGNVSGLADLGFVGGNSDCAVLL